MSPDSSTLSVLRTQRLKVLINGRFLAAPVSGVQRVARELVTALGADLERNPGDVDWTILTPAGADPDFAPASIARRVVRGGRGQVWEQASLLLAARGEVLVNLANSAPMGHGRNVIMIHDAQAFDAPGSYSAAFRTWYQYLHPHLGRRALELLTVSRASADRLDFHRVASEGRIQVIPNGVDHIERVTESPGILTRNGLLPGRFILGFASKQRHKNTELLLSLMTDDRSDGLVLALIGDAEPALRSGAGSNVRYLGRVSDGELKGLYKNALALLLPSKTEGFGLPAGEAMLCGCPTIVSNTGALMEFWGEAGLTAPPSDPDTWNSLVVRLARDPVYRRRKSDKAREIAARYTWRRAAQHLRRVVEAAARRQPFLFPKQVPESRPDF